MQQLSNPTARLERPVAAYPYKQGLIESLALEADLPIRRSGSQMRKYTSHQAIYREDEAASFGYRVEEGAVRISRTLANGQRQVLEIILPGELFGLENSDTYTASADAIGEVVVLRCSKSWIAHQLRESGNARRQFADMLNKGIESAQDHVAMLTHQGALERVALFLLRFAAKQDNNDFSELPVGRQDMADYLGLTIETTCRTLGQMRDGGVIAIGGRRRIEIRSRVALISYANGERQVAVRLRRKPQSSPEDLVVPKIAGVKLAGRRRPKTALVP